MFTIKIKNMEYKIITILFKNNPNSEDGLDGGTHKVDFTNSDLTISGDNIVVRQHGDGGNTITGQIFPLNTVHSYKIEVE